MNSKKEMLREQRLFLHLNIIRKSKFPKNPKRSVQKSPIREKRSVQK